MKDDSNMMQMSQIHKKSKQIQYDLDLIQKRVLPNVLRLLGQLPSSSSQQASPMFSLFFISPTSNLTLCYNIFYLLTFFLIQIQISLELAFGYGFLAGQFATFCYSLVYWLVVGFFAIDIGISFHKGYYAKDKGKVIQDTRLIAKHYLITQFYFDVIALLLLIVPRAIDQVNVNFIQLIPMLLLWIKKIKYQNQIIVILQYNRLLRIFFMLTILFLDLLIIGHYGACIFVAMDIGLWKVQYYGSSTAYYWLSNNTSFTIDLMNGLWYLQYIYAQSYSTGTLSTLAPGPFAKNPIQVAFTLFLMIYFMLLASYIGEILISILYTEVEKRIFHEENIQNFDKYMVLKQISVELKTKIHNFFQLIWQLEVKMQTEVQQSVINLLPKTLKQDLLLEMSFIGSLYMIKYFKHSNYLQRQLAMKINRIIIDSNTCVFKQASILKFRTQETEISSQFIYYLAQGMVKFYICDNKNQSRRQSLSENTLKKVQQSQHEQEMTSKQEKRKKQYILSLSNVDKFVGLYEFLTRQPFQYCCRAVDLCQVDRVSRQDFIQILETSHPQNHQLLHQMKAQVLFQNKLNLIKRICSVCYQNHIQTICPQINYSLKLFDKFKNSQQGFSFNHQRVYKFDVGKNKDRNMLKSKKIHLKQSFYLKKQIINSNKLQFQTIIMAANIINMSQNLINNSKMNQFQQIYKWKAFYPHFNQA